MKHLPVNVSNFRLMIEGNYIYVDKTKIIYELFQSSRLFFLSRPRRFGKSLLISLLEELFSGNKKLFKDTWIGKESDYEWQEFPVIRFDFSVMDISSLAAFRESLLDAITLIARKYDIDLSEFSLLNSKFKYLVSELAKKNKVAILIDEYDFPLLRNLHNPEIAKEIQQLMGSFFAAIKSFDAFGQIQAVFITGVTKFARTSIFSGMNNLDDISLDARGATLLGYTKEELEKYFDNYITIFADANHISKDKTYTNIKEWYNGYQFSSDNVKVYNPYSVLKCLQLKKIENYWLETGTPTFLIELLKKRTHDIKDIDNASMSKEGLGTFEVDELPLIPILFQAGYLTIASYNKTTDLYTLDYPNNETRISFKKYILASIALISSRDVEKLANQFKEALATNNMDQFCTALKSLIANIPYNLHINKEAYYHSLLHVLIDLLGFGGQSEISTSKGRIDLAINTGKRIYIIEIKLNETGQKALKQIKDQRYYEKYLYLKYPITLVGLAFIFDDKELTLNWVKEDLPDSTK